MCVQSEGKYLWCIIYGHDWTAHHGNGHTAPIRLINYYCPLDWRPDWRSTRAPEFTADHVRGRSWRGWQLFTQTCKPFSVVLSSIRVRFGGHWAENAVVFSLTVRIHQHDSCLLECECVRMCVSMFCCSLRWTYRERWRQRQRRQRRPQQRRQPQ